MYSLSRSNPLTGVFPGKKLNIQVTCIHSNKHNAATFLLLITFYVDFTRYIFWLSDVHNRENRLLLKLQR